MRLIDQVKMAGHSIAKSKSRTVLTCIIAFVISLLIMVLVNFGISFSNNLTSMYSTYIQKQPSVAINISDYVSKEQISKLDAVADKYGTSLYSIYFTSLTTSGTEQTFTDQTYLMTDAKYPITYGINILEGKNFVGDNRSSNYALVSKKFVKDYYQTYAKILSPESEFNYTIQTYGTSGGNVLNIPFKVLGIFEYNENASFLDNRNLIFDYHYIFNTDKFASFIPETGIISINVPSISFSMKSFANSMSGITNELKTIFPAKAYSSNSNKVDRVGCSLLQELELFRIMSAILIGLCSFFGVILLLLSVGSLSNSIIISLNNNKKFLGLSKALGLNQRDLKGTAIIESVFTIFVGVLLSSAVVVALSPAFKTLLNAMLTGMFPNYMTFYKPNYILYWYIPVIVSVFFILFSVLFSRGSLNKIAKMDPIEVINEVN